MTWTVSARAWGKLALPWGLAQEAVTLSLAPGEQQVFLFVPRPSAQWHAVTWKDVCHILSESFAKAMVLPVCLGTDVLGEPYLVDLAEAPHLFIGELLGAARACVCMPFASLLESGGNEIELVLIDPKAVEFQAYGDCSRLREGGVIV